MFEAVFTLSSEVKRDDNGQVYFQIYEEGSPTQNLLFPLANIYCQDVYRILQKGDTLTVSLHSDEITQRIIARFREGPQDYVFEEDGFAPCPDLFPRIEELYRKMLDLLPASARFSVSFQIQRL